jgi:hypothetical protein
MNIKEKAVKFLEALGFQDVRPIQGDPVRMMVRTGLKAVRKQLKASNMKFSACDVSTTPGGAVQEFLVIQNRQVIGRVKVESYAVHSIIELEQV